MADHSFTQASSTLFREVGVEVATRETLGFWVRHQLHTRRRRRIPHVDLGARTDAGGQALVIQVEDHALALAQHAENGTSQCPNGQRYLLAGRVGDDRADPSPWVISLHDALHNCGR